MINTGVTLTTNGAVLIGGVSTGTNNITNTSIVGANWVVNTTGNFQVSNNIVDQGGTSSGTWSEVTRQVSGNVSGRVGGGTMQAAVSGAGFTAGLSISTSGNRQSVTIQPSGGDVRAVSVNLMRSR